MASRKPAVTASSPAPDLSIQGGELSMVSPGIDAPKQSISGPMAPNYEDEPRQTVTDDDPSRNLIAQFVRFRESPFEAFKDLGLHLSGTGWRSYEKPIGAPVFYKGFSDTMKHRLMHNPILVAKIQELSQKRVETEIKEGLLGVGDGKGEKLVTGSGNFEDRTSKRRREIENQLRGVAENSADQLICKMDSKPFIRSAYYMVTSLLTRTYHQGIHVSSAEVARLRQVAAEAAKNKHSIVFLPNHKSHVDYVSLQIICFRLGITLPTVVAGDNLNFPLVGPFLQHAGAMYIRRSFGDDQLYGTLVQSYVDTLLANGYNLECFIEGGRSRTGKLLPPKFGILRFILESILSGRVDDTIICPVSTQYDKVIEVDSYITELLGTPKKKESLSDFLSATSILNLKLGRVDIRFHEPWSMKKFCQEQLERYVLSEPILSNPEDRSWTEDRKLKVLRTIGYKVLAEINDVSVIMPTALIGTVLLTLRGRGVGKSELVRRVEWLSHRVKKQGGRVAHFANNTTETVVERGLEVLGPNLVGVIGGSTVAEETYYAVDRFQLSFYRNMTIHLFILDAFVSVALYTRVKHGGSLESQNMPFAELRSQVLFLSQLFRGEFIFPIEGLEANLQKAITGLVNDDVLFVTRDAEGNIEFVELSQAERNNGRENFDFYCFLLWPFVETTWLAAASLMMLTPPPATPDSDVSPALLDMKQVQSRAQVLGKTLYHQGDLSYFESVNKETLANAFRRFEEEGIIIVSKSRDKAVPTTVRIARDWMPARCPTTGRLVGDGRLWSFAEQISAPRREGKNRRDGGTVRSRVLKLIDMVGQPLWEAQRQAKLPGAALVEDLKNSKGSRRRKIGETAPQARL